MKLIVCVDQNWGIGCDGKLLFNIPEDLKFFKEKTINNIVVMGKKTFYSLPNQEPLKYRINIVLSEDANLKIDGVEIVNSLKNLGEILKKYRDKEVFVIGGEMVYKLLLPYCSEAYVTKVFTSSKADRYMENLDESDEWEFVQRSAIRTFKDYRYQFQKYKRVEG